jgi:hypothetical protein
MALGRLADRVDARVVVVLARDADERLRGLLQLVPWGCDGLSLDVMRRDRTAENGIVELMVAELMAHGRSSRSTAPTRSSNRCGPRGSPASSPVPTCRGCPSPRYGRRLSWSHRNGFGGRSLARANSRRVGHVLRGTLDK